MSELDLLRAHRPDGEPFAGAARQRARAELAAAMVAQARRPRRHGVQRLAVAALAALSLAGAMVVAFGAAAPDPQDTAKPWLLGPQPAGALTAIETAANGTTRIRFLHPTADPERIRAELADHGFDIQVTLVPSDPFTVGTLVVYEGDLGIETIREGRDLTGGGFGYDVGIVVPDDWTGSALLGIGRKALPGERFDNSVAVNAERPGGPMHCAGLRGMAAFDAADVVAAKDLRVEWRTQTKTVTGERYDPEPPPASFRIHDVAWTAPGEIMLFAAAGEPAAAPPAVTELISRGCAGSDR